jgi:hypothetical protein
MSAEIPLHLCVAMSAEDRAGEGIDLRGESVGILTGDGDDISQHRKVTSDPRSSVILVPHTAALAQSNRFPQSENRPT